jgi:hypothetical protein
MTLPEAPNSSAILDPSGPDVGETPATVPTPVKSFAIALLGGLFFWALYRVLHTKFPLNYLNPNIIVFALAGLPLGILSRRTNPTLSAQKSIAWGIALVLIGVSALQFKGTSLHYLLGDLYYVYPAPKGPWPATGLVGVLILSPLYFAWLVRKISPAAQWSRADLVATGAGIAMGLVGGHYLVIVVGAYGVLTGAIPCALVLMQPRKWALGLGCASILLTLIFYRGTDAFFTWKIKEMNRVSDTVWTTNYKLDPHEFSDGHCFSPIMNSIVISVSCDNANLLPLAIRQLMRVLATGPDAPERVLEIGRADGHYPVPLLAANPEIKEGLVLEGDPQVASDAQGRFAKYSDHVFTNVFDVSVGERRWLMEDLKPEKPFDLAIIGKVGNMLVFYPMTFIAQENYLFTKEAHERTFNHLLAPDGVLVMDRGSSVVDEGLFMARSLPKDVHTRILWTKLMDFPFGGLPLFYVIASKDEAQLERIVAETSQATNTFEHVSFDKERLREHLFTDDDPFLQWQLAWGFAVSVLPLLFVFWLWLRRVSRQLEPNGPRKGMRLEVFAGLVCGLIFLWLTAKGARAHAEGVNAGFVWTAGTLILACCVGFSFSSMDGKLGRLRALGAMGLLGTAMWIILSFPFQLPMAIASSGGGGLALGIFLRALPRHSGSCPRLYVRFMGLLMGLLIFQLSLRGLGFSGTAVVAGVVMLGVIATMGPGNLTPSAENATT